MRLMLIGGTVLVVTGLFLILKPPAYTSETSVLKLGDFEAKTQQEHRLPEWVGGIALGAGMALVIIGLRKRS
jgi:hypothetical protein